LEALKVVSVLLILVTLVCIRVLHSSIPLWSSLVRLVEVGSRDHTIASSGCVILKTLAHHIGVRPRRLPIVSR